MIEEIPVTTPEDAVQAMVETFSPGGLVNKFLIVAEVIDEDGQRDFWTVSHEGSTRWDNYGLLMEALQQEKAEHTESLLHDAAVEGEDED